MAIVGTDEDENNSRFPTSSSSPNAKAAAAAAPGGGGGGFVGGSGTGSGQGATTGVAASPAATPSQSQGGYVNLSQYLQANQDSGGMTGKGAENVVQQQADQYQQAQNTFNTGASGEIANATAGLGVNKDVIGAINKGTPTIDDKVLSDIKAGGYSYTPATKITDNLAKADTKGLNSVIEAGKATGAYVGPNDFSNIAYSGPSADKLAVSYGGPLTVDSFSDPTLYARGAANSQLGNVDDYSKQAAGGQAGVSGLLKNAYSPVGSRYTKGENALDAFLAGGTDTGKQALTHAAALGQESHNSYDNLLKSLQGQIGAGQKLAGDTNATYTGAVNDANKTAGATKSAYEQAVKEATARGSYDAKTAQEEAAKAQLELDKRNKQVVAASPVVDKLDDVTKVAQNILPPQETKKIIDIPKPTNPTIDTSAIPTALGDAAGKVSAAAKTAIGKVAAKNPIQPTNPTIDTSAIPNAIAQRAVTPDNPTADLNPLGIATAAVNKAGGAAKSLAKKLKFSEGGEVPSYGRLMQMLRRR